MSDLSDFADGLHDEVVSDMAESYFGSRKALEDKLAGFELLVEEMEPVTARLNAARIQMATLLLDSTLNAEFFSGIGMEPVNIEVADPAPFFESLPFAFTGKGRYEKSLMAVYESLQHVTDEYLNGKFYNDPKQKGRKRQTTHLVLLKSLAGQINREVDKVNNEMSPSGTLRYVKKMDPLQMEKESLLGQGCLPDGCSLDSDLKFRSIDFESYALPEPLAMPSLNDAKGAIRLFCKKNYPVRKGDFDQALRRLVSP